MNSLRKTQTTTEKLREKLLEKLVATPVKPLVPLTISALRNLNSSELMSALGIIRNPPKRTNAKKRPKCPIDNPRYQSMPTYDFKNRMARYLEEEYDFRLKDPTNHVISVYEWLANAFEQAQNSQSG